MLDVSADMGVEGVDSVDVHPGGAPLVFSPIYVTIYSVCTGPVRGLHV